MKTIQINCPVCSGQVVDPTGNWWCLECMASQETLDILNRGYGEKVYTLINQEGFELPRTQKSAMKIALENTYQERPHLRKKPKNALAAASAMAHELEIAAGLRTVPVITMCLFGLDKNRHMSIVRSHSLEALQQEVNRKNIQLLLIEDKDTNSTEAILTIDGFGVSTSQDIKTLCSNMATTMRKVLPECIVQERWNQYEFSRL
ncbi:hypothetical protein ACP3V5_17780 [Vibrio maritimus]